MVLTVLALAPQARAESAENYIGAERCKTCHAFEYDVWARGPHARAHKSLTAEQLKDSKCNTCHTMMSDNLDAKWLGIQCERCHGPGRYYHADYVMKDSELARAVGLVEVTEAHCRQCHTDGAPTLEPFDYGRLWARIDHGRDAKKKWEAARTGTRK